MEPIRTVIVDDEPLAREGLRVLLRGHDDIEVVDECGTGAAAVEAVRRERPDLLFLDVQMPEMTGFDVLARLQPDTPPVVIFVTAYDDYALRAFEVHALDYLLKPFDDERFESALDRARKQIRQQQAHHLSERLMAAVEDFRAGGTDEENRRGETPWLERLSVRSGGRVYFLKVQDIDWLEAADYYVKLHVGGKTHLMRESMSNLETRLDPRHFLRIHRSTMVNLDRVKELRPSTGGDCQVVLHDGTRLKLSRSRKDRLHELLGLPG